MFALHAKIGVNEGSNIHNVEDHPSLISACAGSSTEAA